MDLNTNKQQLQHDLRIAPEAPPAYIKLELTGAGLAYMTAPAQSWLWNVKQGWARGSVDM